MGTTDKKEDDERVVTSRNIVNFMVEQAVLSPSNIVDDGVRIWEEERDRFMVKTVAVGGEPIYLVKCARYSDAESSLKKEVDAYYYLGHDTALDKIAPSFINYSKTDAFMIVEWVKGTSPIDSTVEMEKIIKKLGKLISNLHEITPPQSNNMIPIKPNMLTSFNSYEKWKNFYELDRNIKEEWKKIIISGIQHAEGLWKEDVLIHGDLKWEHCLVRDQNGSVSIQIIDWELATLGDPAWDIASILSEIILHAQYNTANTQQSIFDILPSVEIKTFLQSYCEGKRLEEYFLEHTSSYLGVRLFQTALELVSIYGWKNKESKADSLILLAIQIFTHLKECSNILK